MSEHLPECYVTKHPDDDEVACICKSLAACRERTLNEATSAVAQRRSVYALTTDADEYDERMRAYSNALAAINALRGA